MLENYAGDVTLVPTPAVCMTAAGASGTMHVGMSGDPFDLIGEVIGGQFLVETLAGDTDLSVVYRARRLDSTDSVAIKCLCIPETIPDALARALETAFYQAYRVHNRLARGNPNIAQTVTSGEVVAPRSGVPIPYLVREWLEGESLAAELAGRVNGIRTMRPLDEALGLLHGAFDAVAFAHAEGEAHLGINPGNLFVARRADGSVSLKVLDFGLARMMNDFSPESPAESHSGCGLRLLLAGYAAPEQVDEALGPVGPRTDVFALATVATEALSGHKLPHLLEQVLNRALSSDPLARQENAAELWREMSGAVTPRSARAAPEGTGSSPPVVVGAVARPRLKLSGEPSTDTQPMKFESGPPSSMHVPGQTAPEENDPLSMPPTKIPSLVPPVLAVGSGARPNFYPKRLLSLPWARISIGAGGLAAASLLVLVGTTALRSHPSSVATANAASDNLSAQSPSVAPSPAASSSSGGPAEKEPPAAQAPAGESVTAAVSDKQTPFALDTAKRALDSKKQELTKCRRGKAWGYGLATVTFAGDGYVDKVAVAPPLAGTQTGECARAALVHARIEPFAGTPHPVAYKFYVAPK